MNDKKIAKTQRLLAELGHTDVIDALEHAKQMRRALRVIYTWAGDPLAFDARHVRELCEKPLEIIKDDEEK